MLWALLLICSLVGNAARAFDIPTGLTASDRKEVVRTLGLNSANKMLSNPYPLGGYSGLEVGYSLEIVNVRDLRRLGSTNNNDETEWRYSRLSIGKGLYSDVDIFFSFIPPMGGSNVSDYGGVLRWSFYQAQFLPINLAAMVHFNQLNFNDTFMNRNLGAELMVGVNVDNFALYFGGGMLEARGTFTGPNDSGVCRADCTVNTIDPDSNQSSNTASNRVRETHTVVGISAHYQNLFAAAQVDRYRDAVYSLKAGIRF